VTVRSPHAPACAGTTGDTYRLSWSLALGSRRLAEDVREKGRESSQRCDAGDSARRDVFDAAEHAARRVRASVEMKDERELGRQLERHGTQGLIRPRFLAVALGCHSDDDTGRWTPARWNGRQIAVRKQ
jgi:hypothetical protein